MDTYYQMVERDTSTVPSFWKIAHLVSFFVAVVAGILTAYGVGHAMYSFGGYCILYAHIEFATSESKSSILHFTNKTSLPGYLKEIDSRATHWGYTYYCLFSQFTPLVAAIVAIVLIVFFCLCAKGGAGNITDTFYQPWRLVYPTMIVSFIALCCLAVSTTYLNNGMEKFCRNFHNMFDTSRCTTDINLYTLVFHKVQKNIMGALTIAWYNSIIALTAWALQFFLLILRITCIADFVMLKIDVISLEKEKQQVVIVPNAKPLAPIADSEDMEAELDEDSELDGSLKKKRNLIEWFGDFIHGDMLRRSKKKRTFLESTKRDGGLPLLSSLKGEQLPRVDTEPETEMETLSTSSQQISTSADATDKIGRFS